MLSCIRISLPAAISLAAVLFASPVFADKGEQKKPAPAAKKVEETKEKAKEAPKAEAKEEKKAVPAKKVEVKKAEAPEKKEDEKKESLHKVTEEKLVAKTKLSGIVESSRMAPVTIVPKRWADLVVVKAIDHGAEVKKGDVLIELEREKLERTIRDTKAGMPLKEIELKSAELELEKLEKSTPISLESSRRSTMQSEEDFAYYEDVTMPMRIRDAKEDVKQVEQYLAYAEEELNQLKKMYAQDDLTEETEEIILLRAQNTVNEYKWMLEQTKARTDRTLSTTIPRDRERMERSLELTRINWRATEKATRDALDKMRLEVEAKHREMEESQRALKEYEEDLAALTIRAPQDGIVYYGMNQRGKWTTGATVEKKLIPGGKLMSHEIILTVADPNQTHLRIGAAEDKLKGLEEGREAEIALKRDAEAKLTGKVESAARVPYSDATYDVVVSIGKKKDITVLPGMNADAEVVVYQNDKALLVPKTAVKKEDGKSSVTLKGGRKVSVETGRTEGSKIEILKGLKVGDEVVLPAAPEPKAAAADDEKKDETKK